MARALKVFQAQFGFFDSVVAAASQAAALRAWGAHRNLFADKQAALATDPNAIAAALAQPEVPLRRAVGTADPFSLTPGLPRLPDQPKGSAAQKPSREAPATAPAKPRKPPRPPSRNALDAAEARVAALDQAWHAQQRTFRDKRAALDQEEKDARARHTLERGEAADALRRAQQAYIRASRERP